MAGYPTIRAGTKQRASVTHNTRDQTVPGNTRNGPKAGRGGGRMTTCFFTLVRAPKKALRRRCRDNVPAVRKEYLVSGAMI